MDPGLPWGRRRLKDYVDHGVKYARGQEEEDCKQPPRFHADKNEDYFIFFSLSLRTSYIAFTFQLTV